MREDYNNNNNNNIITYIKLLTLNKDKVTQDICNDIQIYRWIHG